MRSICLLGLLGLASLCLSACVQPSAVPITPLPAARTILIVPSAPMSFRVATQGVTAFGDNLNVTGDTNWNLNQLIAKTAVKILSSKYSVSVAWSNTDLGEAQSQQTGLLNPGPGLGSLVQQHIHPGLTPDLYIVFEADASADVNRSEGDDIIPIIGHGIGVDENVTPWGDRPPLVHTYLSVSVLDGKNFQTIYATPLMVSSNSIFSDPSGLPTAIKPIQPLDAFLWKDSWSALTDAQRQQLEDTTKTLLVKSVTYTLSQMAISEP